MTDIPTFAQARDEIAALLVECLARAEREEHDLRGAAVYAVSYTRCRAADVFGHLFNPFNPEGTHEPN